MSASQNFNIPMLNQEVPPEMINKVCESPKMMDALHKDIIQHVGAHLQMIQMSAQHHLNYAYENLLHMFDQSFVAFQTAYKTILILHYCTNLTT